MVRDGPGPVNKEEGGNTQLKGCRVKQGIPESILSVNENNQKIMLFIWKKGKCEWRFAQWYVRLFEIYGPVTEKKLAPIWAYFRIKMNKRTI